MKLPILVVLLASILPFTACTIYQNDQVRTVNYPDTTIASTSSDADWRSYPPNATEISYKGRWDAKYISCEFMQVWRTNHLRFEILLCMVGC